MVLPRFLSALPIYSGAYDGGYNVLTFAMNGATYQVVDESGQRVGFPSAIYELERAVDQATGTDGWVQGQQDILTSLDAEHWDFASASEDNLRLYDRAIWSRNNALLDRFLQVGTPVLLRPSPGQPSWTNPDPPPLLAASGTGNVALINRMLQSVKQPLRPPILSHCLLAAFGSGSVPPVNFWLDHGANPHLRAVMLDGRPIPPNDGVDPLRRGILSGKPEVVRRALGMGFKPNEQIAGSELPLSYAFSHVRPADFNPEVIQVLLAAGADPNGCDSIGNTALIEAGSPEVMHMLLVAGGNPNQSNELGYTPLLIHAADPDLARILLAAGADPTLRDKRGGMVLDAAGELGGCPLCQEELSGALRIRDVDPATFHIAIPAEM